MCRNKLVLCVVIFTLQAFACADVITDWNNVTLDAIRADSTPPPKASRALAMVHAAMYDSVNAVARSYTVYGVAANPSQGDYARKPMPLKRLPIVS